MKCVYFQIIRSASSFSAAYLHKHGWGLGLCNDIYRNIVGTISKCESVYSFNYIEFTIGSYLFILLTKFIQIFLFFLINGVLSHYPIPVTIASFAAFKNNDDNYLMVPEICVRKLSPRTRTRYI